MKNVWIKIGVTAVALILLLTGPLANRSARCATANKEMVFAVDLIRHGDRAPVFDFPRSPYKWPQGLGQLTPRGMDQECQLGKEFRNFYIEEHKLLPEHYDCETLKIRSSDVDRTLMSAECVMLGMYPPGSGPLSEEKTAAIGRYQPIPIHTVPRNTDELLIPDAHKDLHEAYAKYVYASPIWQERAAREKPNFERWGRLLGIKIVDLQQMAGIGDGVFIRQLHHVPVPEGLTEADQKAMIEAGEFVFANTFTPPEVGKIAGGQLLQDICRHFESATSNNSKLKYVLYSAHDSTICALLSAMKAPATVRPHYASDMRLILWKESDRFIVEAKLNGKAVNFPGAENGQSDLSTFEELAR